jgi:hypothetical protein
MKVFCIGFNKTGTASLHEHFERAGLSSTHDALYQAHTRTMATDELRAYLDAHDAFSDGERADFRRLHQLYPDAWFVLNTRGLQAWLESRVKHVFRRDGAALAAPIEVSSPAPELQPGVWSGPMAREYLTDPERAISDWIDRREFFHRSAMRYLGTASPDRFLRLNVTDDPTWQARLDGFLGIVVAGPDTIHANAASADTSLAEVQDRVRQVERVLTLKGIDPEDWGSDAYVGFRADGLTPG